MKYIALLLLGVVSAAQHQSTSLTHLSAKQHAEAQYSESDEDSSDDDTQMVQIKGDDGIIDALTAPKGQCEERLWISEDELGW
jgi:hypothetical protein